MSPMRFSPMYVPAYVIMVDRATTRQLEAVHQAITANSSTWWHDMSNVWIVIGPRSHIDWNMIVGGTLRAAGVEPKVLILQLPAGFGDRHFAALGMDEDGNNWLWTAYRGEQQPQLPGM